MLIEEWMHKKAEENSHNEILAFLMIILGVIFLTVGLLVALIVVGEPNWLLFPHTNIFKHQQQL